MGGSLVVFVVELVGHVEHMTGQYVLTSTWPPNCFVPQNSVSTDRHVGGSSWPLHSPIVVVGVVVGVVAAEDVCVEVAEVVAEAVGVDVAVVAAVVVADAVAVAVAVLVLVMVDVAVVEQFANKLAPLLHRTGHLEAIRSDTRHASSLMRSQAIGSGRQSAASVAAVPAAAADADTNSTYVL